MKYVMIFLIAVLSSAAIACTGNPLQPQRTCFGYKDRVTTVLPDGSAIAQGGVLVEVSCKR